MSETTTETPATAETPKTELKPGQRSQKMERESAAVARELAPAQPRDESGQFASTGTEVETESDTPAAEAGGEPVSTEMKPKRANPTQERINRLTREKHDAERAQARAEGERDAFKTREQAPEAAAAPAAPAVDPNRKPRYEDTGNAAQFHEDVARWGARQELKQDKLVQAAEQKKLHQEEERRTRDVKWTDQVVKAREAHPDWEEVMTGSPSRVTEEMHEFITSSDLGAEIALHLGRSPEESGRIASLDPKAQDRELAKIEARLELEAGPIASHPTNHVGDDSPAAAPAEKPSRTRAAAPLTPPKGGERPAPDMNYLAQNNRPEYRRIREERYAAFKASKV